MFRYCLLTTILFVFIATSGHCHKKSSNNKTIYLTNNKSLNTEIKEGSIIVVRCKIDLGGAKFIIPKQCTLIFENGYFVNGETVFNKTLLEGNIIFKDRVSGSISNDTINTSWFKYSKRTLCDVFDMADGKVVQFENQAKHTVDYAFLIPSCEVLGNNSNIVVGNIKEHSSVGKPIKIRNRHYDGNGVDSFVIRDLNFETHTDSTFLFNMMNVQHVSLVNCSFKCYGKSSQCMHSLDLRGNNHDVNIINCSIINTSCAREGGGLWLRSFGEISNIRVSKCKFLNNTSDEVFAINAVQNDISNVIVDSCDFKYVRNENCPFPHVFWCVANKRGVEYRNVSFSNNKLTSDFMPSYIINSNNDTEISLTNNIFRFEDFKMHQDHLFTTSFNGKICFVNNEVTVRNQVQNDDVESQVNFFSSNVTVKNSVINNDCEKCHLGSPTLYLSEVTFNNSQLFNGSLPRIMENNHIKLKNNTPKLAANPFNHKGKCVWRNNIIESEKPVEFNLMYKGIYIESSNNKLTNLKAVGMQIN